MRIHRLEIQAFGPFATRQIIDFDQLGAQGLFLLNGATGAGKTSILDAIAYALYGTVPGSRSSSTGQLRSHHAGEGVGPEVLCEFSAGGRRLEVRRSPEWMRPVKRGSGTTKEQASTQLREKIAGSWEVKSARNDEAAAEIYQLLGMTLEQFTKVVLLAQGDFAAFLRASAKDRQALLQRLFGTDIYQGVEERLLEEAKDAKAAVTAGLADLAATEELARSQSRQVLAAYKHSVANPVSGQATESPGISSDAEQTNAQGMDSELHGLELFAQLRERLERAVASAAELAEQAEETSSEAADRVSDAQARRARHHELATVLAEQNRLAELAENEIQWRARRDRHHEAQVLATVLSTSTTSAQALVRAQQQRDTAVAEFQGNPLAAATLGNAAHTATAAELEQLDRELTKQLTIVESAVPDEQRHSEKTKELAKNKDNLAGALQREEEQTQAVKIAKDRLVVVQGRQEELRSGALDVGQTAQQAQSAQLLVTAIEEFQDHHKVVQQLELDDVTARESAVTAKEQWLVAMDNRLGQAAGELASKLIDGEPCLVCGSTAHPDPSPLAGEGADLLKTEKAAKKLADAAERAATAVHTRVAEARSTLAVLAERGGDGDLPAARDAVVLREQAHRDAQDAAAELALLNGEATALQQTIDTAQANVLAAAAQAASLTAGQVSLAAEITQLAQELEQARDGHASLAQRRTALVQAQKPGAALLAALRQLAVTTDAAEKAQTDLTAALTESVFDTPEQARDALLTGAEAAALEKKISDFAKALAVNADRLTAPEIVAAQEESAAGVVALDDAALAVLVQERASTQQQAKTEQLAAGVARNAASEVAVTEAAHRATEEAVAPLREQAQLLTGLADAVRGGGDNKYKMTLSSYVLTARLEQVAQAASVRLATMSDARYTLRHSDAKKGNQKSGLGLEVVDEWTGISRDTATLSGGESFMASLSLALGLSDVVQYESGGLDIETLFVDEGFGSLDEQSLEQVMDALEGLRDGGRMVGLVSHVAEMKQRIPLHLHVHKGRHGSTVELKMVGSAAP